MVSRRGHIPSGTAASRGEEPEELLSAKLAPPELPPAFVRRPRLLDRLKVGTQGEVTLICAGPGSGKTSLVAAFGASGQAPGPMAWLSLDDHDNCPTVFWSYLLGALRRTRLITEGTPLERLRPGRRVDETFVRQVAGRIARLQSPIVLVLDDLHEIDDSRVLKSLAFFLRHPTPPLRLVVTSRDERALPLHRPLIRKGVVEIRGAELAFDADEAAELMAGLGMRLTATDLDDLLVRTEGWVTGLTLAADVLKERGPAVGLAMFTGSERRVAEYLTSEVLADLPADMRRVLQRTCVVDQVSGELADALTGATQGRRILKQLARSNAMVTRLDNPPGEFRCHRLLLELLRHDLAWEAPQLARDLHQAAARWFAARNSGLAAAGHAIAAQDWPLAGRLIIAKAAGRMVSVGRRSLIDLMTRIPTDQLGTTASLAMCSALLAYDRKDYEAVAGRLEQARTLLTDENAGLRLPVEILARTLEGAFARSRGDMAGLVEATGDALKMLAEVSPTDLPNAAEYRAIALNNAGVGLLWTGRFGHADRHLRSAMAVAEAAGAELTQLNATSHLALLQAQRGHLKDAYKNAGNSLDLATTRGWLSTLQVVPAYVALALTNLEWNNLGEADAALEAGLSAQRSDPDPTQYFALRTVEVGVLLAHGEEDAARLVAEQTDPQFTATQPPPILTRWHAAAEAELDLAQGRPDDVLGRLTRPGSTVQPNSRLQVYIARAHLMLGAPQAAQSSLAPLQRSAPDVGTAVETWLVTALVEDALRQDHRSIDAFARAVALAQPQNIRRPFLRSERSRVAGMLERHQWLAQQKSPFVASLLAGATTNQHPFDEHEEMERLTDRELDVLPYLPTMLRNQDIAVQMFVSVNTVKAHLRSIYRKLDVTNRREAVDRARDLGLL